MNALACRLTPCGRPRCAGVASFGVVAALVAALLGGVLASEPAFAGGRGHHHGHGGARVGVAVGWGWNYPYWGGGPYWAPRYYYPPPAYYYPPAYYPPAYVVPSAPPVYIERNETPAPQQPQWWYYCRSANAYYPYVRECAEGWQRVPPQPPPG